MFAHTSRRANRGPQKAGNARPAFRAEILESRILLAISLLYDINPGSGNSYIYNMTPVGSSLYFSANDGTHGSEIWRSDGTPGSTNMVADVNPGSSGSSPYGFTEFNGAVYFGATDVTNGRELWKTGGGGASLVANLFGGDVGSDPEYLTVFKNGLFFSADGGSRPGGYGYCLYATDGTVAGTVPVADPDPKGSSDQNHDRPYGLTVIDGTLYFACNDDPIWVTGNSHGTELYRSDGTPEGTAMVADLNTEYDSFTRGTASSSPWYLTKLGQLLVFSATDGISGREIWASDGTDGGTAMISDIMPGSAGSNPSHLVVSGDRVFFTANNGSNGLWATDGTDAVLLSSPLASPDYANMVDFNGSLFFTAATTGGRTALWKSDGSPGGTVVVRDLETTNNATGVTVCGGKLYVAIGSQVWQSDARNVGRS